MSLHGEIARTVWETSRADEGTISATGANHVAKAVIEAIRAMSPDVLAELIGGAVDSCILRYTGPVYGRRAVGPWREVTD